MSSLKRSRRIRWAAPVVILAVIGLLAFIPTISAGADTPNLPSLTAQQLLEKAQAARTADLPGLSGTVQLTANLGIPSLGGLTGSTGGDGAFNPTDLLSGAHSADVWVSKDGFKATYSDSSISEDDVIANANTHELWTWQSRGTKVTHVVRSNAAAPDEQAPSPEAASPVKTPDQVAQSMLDALTPSTDVSVSTPAYVANRAAYELTLAPAAGSTAATDSTVHHIAVAVDDATGLPIRVQIFAKGQAQGQSVLAFDFGFTNLNIAAQDPSMFTFSPPSGATVTTKTVGSSGQSAASAAPAGPDPSSKPTIVGQDWSTVYVFHQAQTPASITGPMFQAAKVQPDGTRVLSTALVNVLFLNNGDVAVGAVSVGRLQHAVSGG
ncbi:MAG TPA: hypothetical protein VGH66_16190 [Acidimicrobiales bacterium]